METQPVLGAPSAAEVDRCHEATAFDHCCRVWLCQLGLGKHVTLQAIYDSGPGMDQPVTVTLTVAPARRV
jgi:hypothetical protein